MLRGLDMAKVVTRCPMKIDLHHKNSCQQGIFQFENTVGGTRISSECTWFGSSLICVTLVRCIKYDFCFP